MAIFALIIHLGPNHKILRSFLADPKFHRFHVFLQGSVYIYHLEETPCTQVHEVCITDIHPELPTASSIHIVGPYESSHHRIPCYSFDPENPFRVYNICGKITLHQKMSPHRLYNPELHPCISYRWNTFFGVISCLYHMHGNLHHQPNSSMVVFKGFRSHSTLQQVMSEVFQDSVQASKYLDMLSATCSFGKHVDVGWNNYFETASKTQLGFHFKARTEEQLSTLNFEIRRNDLSPLPLQRGELLTCNLTRKGIFIVRYSSSLRREWNDALEDRIMDILEEVRQLVLRYI